jgi:hypothetical protein
VRRPLFVFIRAAKEHPSVPPELKHSGILSLEWIIENRRGEVWPLYYYPPPSGSRAIEEVAQRIFKNRGPVRNTAYGAALERVAESVYDSSSQLSLFIRRNDHYTKSGCFANNGDDQQRIYETGSKPWDTFHTKTIPIALAKKKPCRWCDRPVFYKDKWIKWNGTVRCNSAVCRRIDYLQDIPQSRGGIDLTPAQRKASPREAWDTHRAINYLALVAKETKRANRSANHDIR